VRAATAIREKHDERLAEVHHGWVDELMAGVDAEKREHLLDALGALKTSITAATPGEHGR
jgi:hypothetical protein